MRTARIAVSVTVMFFLVGPVFQAGSSAAEPAEWPCWRGPSHDGKSPETGLLKEWPSGGPKKLWQADDIGKGFSTVSVSGGLIYTTGDVGGDLVLFAFDMDGKLQWKQRIDAAWTRSRPGSRSTPTIDTGRLYLLSGNGVITCRDAKSGQEKWTKSTRDFGGRSGGWGYAESILILDKLAIVKPGGGKCIVALDKATGETTWTSSGFSAGPEYSSCLPFTYQGKLCLTTGTRSGIVCVDAKDGALLWSNPWSRNNTANCPDPAYADGHVFWANGYGKGGICMKLKVAGEKVAADEAWTTKDMVCHHGGYVIHEGHIYGNNGGGWACLDLKSGQKKWYAGGVGKGSVRWADGMLYLFGESGGKAGLATCSPDGFEMKGTFSVEGSGPSWAHPVVIGGRLYLRYDTHLYCFDVKAG
ncbi:MAG: PQQ-binding-like beta-propeller repeat protein [Phycisphaerae bacterium]